MHDLIVVGAGLAGLALAARAHESGLDVLVLEARERIGGRILSHQTAAGRYDLGPAWVWPEMQPRVARATAAAGLALFPQAGDGGLLFEDSDGTVQRLRHGFAQSPPNLRIAGGIEALAAGFAARLPESAVRLSMWVTGLALDGDTVIIEADAGAASFHARQVALALPPRLVAGLGMTPALPAPALRALRAVPTWMAGHAKALAIYDRPFWREAGLSGGAFSRHGPLAEIHDASLSGETDEAALFGFFGWPAAERAMQRGRLEAAVTSQLAALFGSTAARPRELVIRDWSEDAMTATDLDQAALAVHPDYAPMDLPPPWAGRVILTGSEVAPEFGGYLEGALAAAAAGFAVIGPKKRPPS